jgi:hypothetical protein
MPPRQCTKTKPEITNLSRRIRLPIDREDYDELIKDKQGFREMMDYFVETYPELFPPKRVQLISQ